MTPMPMPTVAPPSTSTAGRRMLATIVAWDLPSCAARLPSVALADGEWAPLLALARAQRAEGPLARAIASGALAVTPDQQDQAFAAHRSAMSLTLVLERDLLALRAAFADAGVDIVVVKGAATSHLDEADPSSRSFGDIDLLVRPSAIAASIGVIEAAGGVRRHLEPRPGFDARFSKGVSFRFPGNCEIDLHRTLAPGPFGLRIDLDELFDRRERYGIAGTRFDALDRPSRFLHACYHAALGDAFPRLTSLRDLVLTAPRTDDECRTVLDRATRWQSTAVVGAALDHAVEAFAWQVPEPLASWQRRAPRPVREQRWLAAYAGDQRLPALQAIHGIGALDRLRDRLAYACAIALPSMSASGTPLRVRARRGARALARLTRS